MRREPEVPAQRKNVSIALQGLPQKNLHQFIFLKNGTFQYACSTSPKVVADLGLFDRINLDSKIQIKYIDTKNQLADTLTEGNFTRDEWNHVLCLFNISHFSSTDCSEVMSKRTKKDSGEERVIEKSKTMMNLVSSTASESRMKNQT